MPSSFTKEGDANEYNGSINFIVSNIYGTIFYR